MTPDSSGGLIGFYQEGQKIFYEGILKHKIQQFSNKQLFTHKFKVSDVLSRKGNGL
jgi:hypothetical protein